MCAESGPAESPSTPAETLDTNESNPMNVPPPVVVVSDADLETTTVVDVTSSPAVEASTSAPMAESPVTSALVSETTAAGMVAQPHAVFSKCAAGTVAFYFWKLNFIESCVACRESFRYPV